MERRATPPEDTGRCQTIAGNSGEPGAKTRKPKPKGFPRDHVGYWKAALRKCPKTGNYTVQIYCHGRRGSFTFGRNAEKAAEQARAAFLQIKSDRQNGWLKALEEFSPRGATRAREELLAGRIAQPTIGDVIRVCSELSTARPATVEGYAKALRFLVSQVFGIAHTCEVPGADYKGGEKRPPRVKDRRYDYRNGGRAQWCREVEAVRLDRLTPAEVQRWCKRYLAARGSAPVDRGHASVSFNKTLRNAKALFSRQLLPMVESKMVLPRPLFFEGVAMLKTPPMRYRSVIDPAAILQAAADDLAQDNREAFKALFLCLVLGLRRSEADTLMWEQVDFDQREVVIMPTEHNLLKSRDSARPIALDDTALGLLRGWHAKKPRGLFVLESQFKPRLTERRPEYRCNATFAALAEWLRSKGVTADKPIHELRKECGTLLLKQGHPLEVVSRYLGHSSVQVTMAHYADIAKQRASVSFSSLLPAGLRLQSPTAEPFRRIPPIEAQPADAVADL